MIWVVYLAMLAVALTACGYCWYLATELDAETARRAIAERLCWQAQLEADKLVRRNAILARELRSDGHALTETWISRKTGVYHP